MKRLVLCPIPIQHAKMQQAIKVVAKKTYEALISIVLWLSVGHETFLAVGRRLPK